MGLSERRELCNKIESHRKRPLIVYATSKRDGVNASVASDVLPYLIEQLDSLPKDATELDFLIVSYGGDPMAAWRIVSLIRERVDKVFVLIPQSAYSAATLIALGGDEIVMHPNGNLGPVDMQITTSSEGRPKRFSTEDISAFIDYVKTALSITDQKHLRRLFEETCREVGSLGVGFTARSQKLAIDLGERLLGMHMRDDDTSNRNRTLVENLSRQFHSHSYPVSRTEAINIGLPVNKDRDPALESLMWLLWLDLEKEMKERQRFHPITEILNSEEAAKLLSPVPQLSMPSNAPNANYFQSSIDDVKKAGVDINPVDFETVDAIIESSRLAYRGVTQGKILASRQPDLILQFNALVTFNGWKKHEEQQ